MCYGIMYDSGSGMRIVGPEDVKQQYKVYLQSVLRNYKFWQQEKIILKSQKKPFLLSYYMVY